MSHSSCILFIENLPRAPIDRLPKIIQGIQYSFGAFGPLVLDHLVLPTEGDKSIGYIIII